MYNINLKRNFIDDFRYHYHFDMDCYILMELGVGKVLVVELEDGIQEEEDYTGGQVEALVSLNWL